MNSFTTTHRNREKVEVICRFRPQLPYEIEKGGEYCIEFVGNDTVYLKNKGLYFTFDRMFNTLTSQDDIFEALGRPAIDDLIKGYNCTLLSYGQTSSGKTYSMMNCPTKPATPNKDQRGLAPRLIDLLFEAIDKSPNYIEFTVKVCFYEVYMEKVFDLLEHSKGHLIVKEDTNEKVFYVENLTEIYVGSEQEALNLLKMGNKNKKISQTQMNRNSSRSHTIFSLLITQLDTRKSQKIYSKLNVVDLAGSEKVSKTEATGVRLEEAKNINKSLATLSKVISCLTDKNSSHIPYRESKLTKLLQDAIGGNSRTALLVNCSPSNFNEEETTSTLRFGTGAKCIKNKPKVNLEASDSEFRKQLSLAKAEIVELKARNSALEAELNALRTHNTSSSEIEKTKELYLKKIEERDELLSEKEDELDRLKSEIENYKHKENINHENQISALSARLTEYKEKHKKIQTTNKTLYENLARQEKFNTETLTKIVQLLQNEEKRSKVTEFKRIINIVNLALAEINNLKKDKKDMSEMIGTMEKELNYYYDKISSALLNFAFSPSIKTESRKEITENHDLDSSGKLGIYPKQMRDFMFIIEEQNRIIRKELDALIVEHNSSVKLDELNNLKRIVEKCSSYLDLETRDIITDFDKESTTSPHKKKVVVPLKGGFKKLQQHLSNSLSNEDDEAQPPENEMLKCGYLFIKERDKKQKKLVWKQKWFVLHSTTPFLSCYKTLKSITRKEIPINEKSTVERYIKEEVERRLDFDSKGDENKFCFTITNKDGKMFTLKATNEEEKEEWIRQLNIVLHSNDLHQESEEEEENKAP
ncbi:hypothetical protein ABK040_012914 [Willaertia magna]